MLTHVAEGVWFHRSPLIQNNSIVVQGDAGVLVVDAGITGAEMACLAHDIRELGQTVVAGFSTHPDWDHVLWHSEFGEAPRYATVRGASFMEELLAQADWKAQVTEGLPPEIADEMSLDRFGQLTGVTDGRIPWDGPEARLIEHPAHAQGHAALLVGRVLVAGDMLSDILPPFPDPGAADPLGDYLAGLDRLESVADDVDVVIPGHGSVGNADQVRTRIDMDRAYVQALLDGQDFADPRLGPDATYGQEWLPEIYQWHRQQFARGEK